MSNENNRNSLMDCLMNRRVFVSVLVAIFVLVGLASPAIAQASTDAVLIQHFDEGSGTIAKDESGHGNDGTIYGATWTTGISGKALEFDGVDDYVDFGNLGLTNSKGTIEVWVYPKRIATGYYGQIFSVRDNTLKNNIQFYVKEGSGTKMVSFYMAIDGTPVIDISGQITQNEWYHVVITQDGTTSKMYIDGVLQPKTGSGEWFDDLTGINEYAVGRLRHMSNYYFNGAIDEIRIYNLALTADEIKEHYEGKQPELTLTKSASPSTIQEGETTTISIRIENTGTGDAKSVEVTDTIPTGFKIISGSKSASFDEIKPGDYRTSEYTLKATGSGKFTCEPATAAYKDADGNSYSAVSNSVSIQVGGEVPVGADSDGDGWSDEKEKEMGTNPYSVDSDGDGLKDPEDPNPTVPEEKKKTPGFEVVFAIAGLLAVAYLLRRRG
jgi:PGF-CTERM protein/uncharacterized repeat protein (TIGR01451 family)